MKPITNFLKWGDAWEKRMLRKQWLGVPAMYVILTAAVLALAMSLYILWNLFNPIVT